MPLKAAEYPDVKSGWIARNAEQSVSGNIIRKGVRSALDPCAKEAMMAPLAH